MMIDSDYFDFIDDSKQDYNTWVAKESIIKEKKYGRYATEHEVAESVALRYKYQMYNKVTKQWAKTISGDSEIKYKKIVELGRNPNPIDICNIIGNRTYTPIEYYRICDIEYFRELIEKEGIYSDY